MADFSKEQWKWKHEGTRTCLKCADGERQAKYNQCYEQWSLALLTCKNGCLKPRSSFPKCQRNDNFGGERECLECQEVAFNSYIEEKEARNQMAHVVREEQRAAETFQAFTEQLDRTGPPPGQLEEIRFASWADGITGVTGLVRLWAAREVAGRIEAKEQSGLLRSVWRYETPSTTHASEATEEARC